MIQWCCYCQRFLGEKAPFDIPSFTHAICEACDARLERDEPLKQDTAPVRSLFGRLLDSARAGDEAACASVLVEARALGLADDSVLVGLLQPALYQAGLDWHEGRMSVAAEHRLTSWCERVFGLLAPRPRRRPPDLLILQTPGNTHTVGPRFAVQVLAARGLAVEAVVPALPFDEMVALALELRPRLLGFSCALPEGIQVASELIERLRARLRPTLDCRYLLSGFAFRLGGGEHRVNVPPGIEVVRDLETLFPRG